MADLVRILSRPVGSEINSVDARELHQALESRQDFSTWIKARTEQLGFLPGVDFEKFFNDSASTNLGSANRIDYTLTIDAAKHVALAERSEVGRRVRSYFIEAEKKLRAAVADPMAILADPAALRGLLGSYAERVERLEATVAEQSPKIEAYGRLTESFDTFGFREACQQVRAATGANENETRQLMRERGWIQRLGKKLAPASYGVTHGYVTTRENSWTDEDGTTHVRPELRVTSKGVARAAEILLAQESAA